METRVAKRSNSKDVFSGKKAKPVFNMETMQCRAVSRNSVQTMLKKRHLARAGCLSVPFTISFFIFFTLSVMLHEDVRKIFLAEFPLRKLLKDHKGLNNINEISEVWAFLQIELLPTLFRQTDHVGQELPYKEWGKVLGKQQVKGGVLIEQHRMPDSPNPGSTLTIDVKHNVTLVEELLHFNGEGMVDAASIPGIRGDTGGNQGRLLMSSAQVGGASSIGAEAEPQGVAGAPENSYPIFLFEQETFDSAKHRLGHIEAFNWVDRFTVQISVRFLLVNSETRTIQRVAIRFVFPESGGVYTAVNQESVFMTSYRRLFSMFVDFVLLILLLYISFEEGSEVYKSMKRCELKVYFFDVWNVLDWITIFCGWFLVFMFALTHFKTDAVETILFNEAHGDALLDMKYWKTMYELQIAADELAFLVMWFRIFISDYMLLIMFRLFKAFKGHPRLAVVTNTIKVAGSDLFHFGIVFTSVFLAFAYSGTLLFGRRLSGFSTFSKSCGTCFSIACGEFQWAVMTEEHEITSTLWFWGFMVLIYLVMLNMVLAIVMNVYTRVHEEAIAGDPIWKSASHLLRNAKTWSGGSKEQGETELSDPELIDALKEITRDFVTAKTLQDGIPNISKKQACQIVYDTEMWELMSKGQGMTMTEAMTFIRDTHTKVESLVYCIDSRAMRMKRLKWKLRRAIFVALYDGTLKGLAHSLGNEKMLRQAKEFELDRKISRAETFLSNFNSESENTPQKTMQGASLRKSLTEANSLDRRNLDQGQVKTSTQNSQDEVQKLSQRIESLETKVDAINERTQKVDYLEAMMKDMHSVIMSSYAASLWQAEQATALPATQINQMMNTGVSPMLMPSHSSQSFGIPVQSNPNVLQPVIVQPAPTPGLQNSLYPIDSGEGYTSSVTSPRQPYPMQWSPANALFPGAHNLKAPQSHERRHHRGQQMSTWQQRPDAKSMPIQQIGVVPDTAPIPAAAWAGMPPEEDAIQDLTHKSFSKSTGTQRRRASRGQIQPPGEFEAGMPKMPTSTADQLRSAVSACVQEDFASSVRGCGNQASEGLLIPGQWVPSSPVAPPMYELRSEVQECKRRAKNNSKQVCSEPESEGNL